ncbi:MAG: hypothetical protein FJ399_06720, partial [Verrucomicrobia bacterium]|nr:hypothetical protein [Verrucomicrobiota bacterium]
MNAVRSSRVDVVLVAESATEVALLASRLPGGGGRWLALGPSAIHALHRECREFLTPDDLVARGEIESICVPAYEALRETCRQLDAALQRFEPDLRAGGIELFGSVLWELGALVDGYIWRALVLRRVCGRGGGLRFLVAGPRPEETVPAFRLLFRSERRFWPRVLAQAVPPDEIEWVVAGAPASDPGVGSTSPFGRRLKGRLSAALKEIP